MHHCGICGSTELQYVPLIPTEIRKYNIANGKYFDPFITQTLNLATCCDLVTASEYFVSVTKVAFSNLDGFLTPFLASFLDYLH